MTRIYIDSDEAEFSRSGKTTLTFRLYGGEKYENVEPRRLFPTSGLSRYISLLDSSGCEIAIIRDMNRLSEESRKAVGECLDEYYMVPKILSLVDRREKYGIIKWTVETDRGRCSFEIKNTSTDIKILYDRRTLIRDSNDNRYEIEDIEKLDKKSRALLKYDI